MRGYGLANLNYDVPVTPETVFELASLTKQFTATAIMLLVEEGRVKLDDPISEYLPNCPDQWKGITVRHLLTQTAGLADREHNFRSLLWKPNISTAEMYDAATKDPVDFAPGDRWQYSDEGYFLLGVIIEKASGQRYRDFLEDRFFKWLGMSATSVLDQWAIVKNLAAGYTKRDGRLVNIRRITQVKLPSHYGVFSTVRDLAKWETALAAGKVVGESSLDQMWTPVRLNSGKSYPYGFGWEINETRGHRVITHTGITGTEYTRFPDDKLTVIVLTNLGAHVGARGINSWGLTKEIAGYFIRDPRFSSVRDPWVVTTLAIVQLIAAGIITLKQVKVMRSIANPALNAPEQRMRRVARRLKYYFKLYGWLLLLLGISSFLLQRELRNPEPPDRLAVFAIVVYLGVTVFACGLLMFVVTKARLSFTANNSSPGIAKTQSAAPGEASKDG